MLGMLAAFEISSTLLTSAALGFLGYYIGGEVWVAVTDTSSVRTSGMPELGLMVATLSTDIFAGPYKMVAAASLIFLTILGFNLLGEGLRLRVERGRPRTSAWRLRLEQAALDFDHHYVHPLATLLRTNRLVSGGLAVILVGLLAGLGWLFWKPVEAGVISAALSVPGGHLWASQFHDPFGTYQTPAEGPHSSPVVLWTKPIEGSFSGGPAVAADGTLYLTTVDGRMLTYTQSGQTNWPAGLIAEPVGSPALSAQGRVYVADTEGGLTAVSPAGDILWRMDPEGGAPATSGPVVDEDGNIYYMRAGQVQAVSPQGSALWLSQARNLRTSSPPALSPDGSLLFAQEAALRRADGAKLDVLADADTDQFFSGADGKLYVRSRFALAEWQYRDEQAVIVDRIEWDHQLYGLISPPNQVGADASSNIWMLYVSSFEDGHFIWVDRGGNVTGDVRFPHRETSVIGLDGSGVAYICGTSRVTGTAECLALQPGLDEPLWTLELPFGSVVTGGAVTPGRLYVATEEGYLMALGVE
jgi:outer membrane protein assembly factor BamB